MVNDNNPTDPEKGYNTLTEQTDSDDLGNPWGTSPYQRTFAWPATTDLLPNIEGTHVLLAGCGRGDHVEWFLNRGADVVGVDIAGKAIATARDRYGDVATFRHGSLTDVSELVEGSVDVILSHLVLSHIESWKPIFAGFREVATDSTILVITTVHPQYLKEFGEVEQYTDTVGFVSNWGSVDLPTYYRPMSLVLNAITTTGWRIEMVHEPVPPEEFQEYDPDRYAAALERPELLTLRAQAD
ncbi:class I SAM-dependent methyltransferase [Haladaptatus halobius]|uniref:class I SAM-dependent methyltransferase n=1 Tax=Haladaptatus halobius TaxID=2884875 RepID=UPI001D0B7320|nr:class I SAM-dependent methyltransferase [Haladaptatus halobius]